MPDTHRLGLPLLDAAQAQKHVTHNEALTSLDALVQLSVSSRNVVTPPASPTEGARVLVGTGASGIFSDHVGALAAFDNGGWAFYTPRAGWRLHVSDENVLLLFDGTAWNDIGLAIRELQGLSGVGIGTSSDATNALAAKLNAGLFTARATGEGGTGDVRLVLNKSTASNTGSYLFQTGYSGRAEAGLTGSDDFALKVSSDGTAWHTGLTVDAATGVISFPSGTGLARLRSGAGAPFGAANAGDFWIDTTNSRLYGPFAGTSWPSSYVAMGGASSLNNVVAASGFATPILPNGSDMTAALTAALAALYAVGGGVIVFDGGAYRFDGQVTLPYDDSASAPKGVPIAFRGAGEWRSGRSTASVPNGGTQFDIRYSGANAWLLGLAEAPFVAEAITFTQKGVSAVTTPIMLFTNTVPMISRCGFEGHSSKTAATADQDCILLGGTSNASFGGSDPTQPFQGFGAVIERCHFNRIRRGVFGRVYANALVVRDNCFWAQCGGAEAIRFDSGTTDFCVGGVITGNIIEMVGYTNAISMVRCQQWFIAGNNCYDPKVVAEPYLKLSNCTLMNVIAGAHADTVGGTARPYVNDTTQCATYLAAAQGVASKFDTLQAGVAGYPNRFGPTIFTSFGAEASAVQPTANLAGVANDLFVCKRSAAESVGTAGVKILAFDNAGGITINPTGDGTISAAGNIANGLSTGASWSANGRTWSANSAGGAMSINSGTGGSYLSLRNYATKFTRWDDGSLVSQIGPQFGGAGKEGIGLGTTSDVAFYRDSAGVGTFAGLPVMPLFTVATLPSATPARKGARATVTDAVVAPVYGASAAGGGWIVAGVLCTGSGWTYG